MCYVGGWFEWWGVGMDEIDHVGASMFMVSIGSVKEYVSGIVMVMVWLVCRFNWVVKKGWGLKAWVVHMWYGLYYRSTI